MEIKGWTGFSCPACKGTGWTDDNVPIPHCSSCAGTGEEYGILSPEVVSEKILEHTFLRTALHQIKAHGMPRDGSNEDVWRIAFMNLQAIASNALKPQPTNSKRG